MILLFVLSEANLDANTIIQKQIQKTQQFKLSGSTAAENVGSEQQYPQNDDAPYRFAAFILQLYFNWTTRGGFYSSSVRWRTYGPTKSGSYLRSVVDRRPKP